MSTTRDPAGDEEGELVVERKKRRVIKTEKSVPGAAVDIPPGDAMSLGEETRVKQEPKQSGSVTALTDAKSRSAAGRGIFFYEENELANRDPRKDLELHKNVCVQLRTVMESIRKAKRDGADAAVIDAKMTHGMMQFVSLKKLNRIAHYRSKKVRDATTDAKLKIDQQHLRLQNLLYEVMHLQKEVSKCLQFRSKNEEIALVSLPQFYAEAPAEISRPEVTKSDVHQQTLARLNWELEQRKTLTKRLVDSRKRKDEVTLEISEKQKYLEKLRPMLDDILKSTKSVQEYLRMPFDDVRDQLRTAADLPPPLYVLFVQASAYGEAIDKNLVVSIQGDVQLVRADEDVAVDNDDESDNSEGEEENKNGAGNGDKVSKNKRHRRSVGSDSRLARKRERILRKHPLSIVIQLKGQEGSLIDLTFSYLVSFGIVTVSGQVTGVSQSTGARCVSGGDLMNPDTLFNSLYPADDGDDTPNPANRFALAALEMGSFCGYISKLGRPYAWAQTICGLQFPAVTREVLTSSCRPDKNLSAEKMDDVVCRLRKRVQVRRQLQNQLSELELGGGVFLARRAGVGTTCHFPTKISSRLADWRRSTYVDYAACLYNKTSVELGLVSHSDLYFTGKVERGSATMTFHAVVNADYPRIAPLFALLVRWNGERSALSDEGVRDMEAEVNVHCLARLDSDRGVKADDSEDGSKDQLLLWQLQTLLVCFDIYLETDLGRRDSEGPAEMAREKICPRMYRGPDRSRPYRYNAGLGFFSRRS